MRRKGTSRDTMAIKNDLERTLAVAVFAVSLLLAFVFIGESAQESPKTMQSGLTVAGLGHLPDPDRDSLRVAIAKLEVR